MISSPSRLAFFNKKYTDVLYIKSGQLAQRTGPELVVNQRTIGPENAHLKPDPAVLSHHEMTLTLIVKGLEFKIRSAQLTRQKRFDCIDDKNYPSTTFLGTSYGQIVVAIFQ